ncbi:MAG TPA: DUF5723 family protein [Puia sp.]|nr:DUF5723 family protein [Puia sp.]
MICSLRKGITFLCFAGVIPISSFSQDLAGLRTGNYTGVDGVFFNPANIAGSKYKWDVNLWSLNLMVGNDNASYSLKDLTHSLNGDTLKQRIAGAKSGTTSAMMNLDLLGPSFMVSIGKKNAFAFTSRVRVMANTKEVDGKLLNQFITEDVDDPELPYTFSTSGDNKISVNAWTEFGASFGRVLLDQGPHYFKGGITLKYLAGVANGYLQMTQLQGVLGADPTGVYMTQTSGTLGVGFGGTRIDDIKDGHLGGLHSSGFGGDIGFVYEFRPLPHGYLLRAGIALVDVGSISYKQDASRTGTYSTHILAGQKLYVDDFGAVDNYNSFLQSHPQYFTPVPLGNGSSYSVSLPTSLHLDLDYHVLKGLYANLSSQFSLAANKPYNSSYYNAFVLTPRWENRHFGFYLPVGYNALTHFNAGFSARVGPFFFGSGSVLSAVLKDSKQADFFLGFRFGGLRKG